MTLRLSARATLRVTVLFAFVRGSLDEAAEATGLLATMAFFVVFRVLIRDFFWMVTLVSFDLT
jgi:hypothetical protein